MEFKEIQQKYIKIIEDIDKTLIESELKIKQAEKEMEEIQEKARENIQKLSHLL